MSDKPEPFNDNTSDISASELVDTTQLESNDETNELVNINVLEDNDDDLIDVTLIHSDDTKRDVVNDSDLIDVAKLQEMEQSEELVDMEVLEAEIDGTDAVEHLDDMEAGENTPESIASIWDSNDYGREFELRENANIAGNFPVIDDFRDGNATSLKTCNLRNSYQGEDGAKNLERTLIGYIDKLADYQGRDREAGETTWAGVTVRDQDINRLTLRVGVPSERTAEQQSAIDNAISYAKSRETALGAPLDFDVKDCD